MTFPLPAGRPAPQRCGSACLLLLSCLLCGGCAPAAPAVVVDEPDRCIVLRAGEVQQSSDPSRLVNAEFVFRNTGDQDAVATLASVGCGCYRLICADEELSLHDTVVIPARGRAAVRFNVHPPALPDVIDYRAEFDVAAGTGLVRLPLRCEVRTVADVAVSPDVVTHELGSPAGEHRLRITRCYRSGSEPGTDPVWEDLPSFAELRDVRPLATAREEFPGLFVDEWEALLRVNPEAASDLPSEPVPIAVTFQDGGFLASGRTTLVFGRRTGIDSPGRIHFGRVPAGQNRSRQCLLRAADDVPFRILETASESGHVSGRAPRSAAAIEQWLELELTSTTAGELRDRVRCRTDHPDAPEIHIEVQALVTAAGLPRPE